MLQPLEVLCLHRRTRAWVAPLRTSSRVRADHTNMHEWWTASNMSLTCLMSADARYGLHAYVVYAYRLCAKCIADEGCMAHIWSEM